MIKQLLNSAFVSSEELWRSRRVLFDEFVLAAKKGYIMTTPCLNDTPIHDGINAKLFRLRLMWIRLTKGVQLFLTKLLSFLHHSMCEPKTSHNLSYYDEGLGVRSSRPRYQGRGRSQKHFLALRTSVWSINMGGRPAPLDPPLKTPECL